MLGVWEWEWHCGGIGAVILYAFGLGDVLLLVVRCLQ